MSLIKLEVSVNADNALVVAEFIKSLAGCAPQAVEAKNVEAIEVKDAEEVQAPEPKKEPAKRAPRAKKPEPVEEEQAEEEQAEEEQAEEEQAEEEQAEETKSGVSVDDIRALQAQKVTAHRDAIIEKFKKLGAKGISSLDEEHFEEYYNFLSKLK